MAALHEDRLPNGLRLVAEARPAARSTAMTLLLPAGVATEPAGGQGLSAVLAEMIFRGAGRLDARGHSDALDRLGVQRDAGVGDEHLQVSAVALAEHFAEALPLVLDMVRRPALSAESLEPARDLALQAIAGLEDEPQQRVMERLQERHEPPPFDRSTLGRAGDLAGITLADVHADWARRFVPGGSILAVAGPIDWPALRADLERRLGDWAGAVAEPVATGEPRRGAFHETTASQQAHIGLAWEAVSEPDPRRPLQEAATAVMSGGTSGRLFQEVRERRGLCYAVSARYAGRRDSGAVLGYAGTTPERAQRTLDVILEEMARLRRGVTSDELELALAGLRTRLAAHGESTAGRASAIAVESHLYGAPRALEQQLAELEAIDRDAVNAFLAETPAAPSTLVTVGPEGLAMTGG